MQISLPYGDASRQVMVELNPDALNAFSIPASEVIAAVSRQNLTLPTSEIISARLTAETAVIANSNALLKEVKMRVGTRQPSRTCFTPCPVKSRLNGTSPAAKFLRIRSTTGYGGRAMVSGNHRSHHRLVRLLLCLADGAQLPQGLGDADMAGSALRDSILRSRAAAE